jgi:hypothetical protein
MLPCLEGKEEKEGKECREGGGGRGWRWKRPRGEDMVSAGNPLIFLEAPEAHMYKTHPAK